ncbi:MAG: hypothetical protein U1F11_05060 [Steroidobacteraceae bacterium]
MRRWRAPPRAPRPGQCIHLLRLPPGRRGPRLIEINTNAGGALLTALLAGAYSGCCAPAGAAAPTVAGEAAQHDIVAMFEEWRLQRHGDGPPSLLVVDEPRGQYPSARVRAVPRAVRAPRHPTPPSPMRARSGGATGAWRTGAPLDMVYNRLTDFELAAAARAALRAAFEAGAIVLTPHPGSYALYADKRNLVALGDPQVLETWGVAAADRALLAAVVPRTAMSAGLAAGSGPSGGDCSSSPSPATVRARCIAATSSRAASGTRSSPATTSRDRVEPGRAALRDRRRADQS